MKTTFIAVAKGRIAAEARCLHHGTTVSLCEGEIKDGAGRTIARASGTFMLRKEQASK
jgi:acyl-coenzyme A thioesterase PaaI-like protein